MPVRNRRQAREAALRALYSIEVGKTPLEPALAEMREVANLTDEMFAFAEHLVRGAIQGMRDAKTLIRERVPDYPYERLAVVDRNLLRIAIFELYHCPEIPPAVTLNEAIELAKKYSTAESGKFVNGVLGRILEKSPKAEWEGGPILDKNAEFEEPAGPEPEPETEEVTVEADSEEAKSLAKAGIWKLRTEEP